MTLKRRLLSMVAAALLAAGVTAIAVSAASTSSPSGSAVAVDPGCGGCGNGGD